MSINVGSGFGPSKIKLTNVCSVTEGAIPFGASNNCLTEDPTNLFWDDANNRLGVGTNTPAYDLDVAGTLSADSININDAFTLPTIDGTVNQVLETDGSGSVTWVNPSSGSAFDEDTILVGLNGAVLTGFGNVLVQGI